MKRKITFSIMWIFLFVGLVCAFVGFNLFSKAKPTISDKETEKKEVALYEGNQDKAMATSHDEEIATVASGTTYEIGNEDDNITATVENGTLTISGSGKMKDWTNENDVPWHEDRASISEVKITGNIENIGNYAFNTFTALENIDLPESVLTIGSYSFASSGLTELSITSVNEIGMNAFRSCFSLSSVTIDNKSTTIGYEAFYDSGLSSFRCYYDSPAYKYALSESLSGNSIDLLDENLYFISDSPSSGNTVIAELQEDGILIISGTGEMKDWSSQSEVPWYDNKEKITSVVIKDGVTSIGSYAFDCLSNLTDVNIPSSVTKIKKYAFYNCTSLKEIEVPSTVETLEDAYINLDNPNQIKVYCKTNSKADEKSHSTGNAVRMKENCEWTISAEAEGEDNHVTARLYEDGKMFISGTGEMKDWTVSSDPAPWYSNKDSITSVEIYNGVTNIGNTAFWYCEKLLNIALPDSIIDIGVSAFWHCTKLLNIALPDSIINIGDDAFHFCDNLTIITIPDNVTSLGYYNPFSECEKLTTINVNQGNNNYKSENGVLFSKNGELICYPAGKTGNNYDIPHGVVRIGTSAFSRLHKFNKYNYSK